MHYPHSSHPYFKVHPTVFAATKSPVSLCFGEAIKPSQRGKFQVNSNEAANLIRNKVKLLQFLESKGIEVPKPIHSFEEFLEEEFLNIQKFEDVMSFPVQARRADHTVLIEHYTDLMKFIQSRKGNDYAVHGMDYQEYTRGSITLSPRLKGTSLKTPHGIVVEGVIHVEGIVDAKRADALQIATKVATSIKFDVGTVEFLINAEAIMVENVNLSPTPQMIPTIDHIIRMVMRK